MSALSPVFCLMGRHDPLRRRVEWNGHTYVGKCRGCGKDIERVGHKNWKLSEAHKPA